MKRPIGKRDSFRRRQELIATRAANAALARAQHHASGRPTVYVDEHLDEASDRIFWSVNVFDGESGSQSQPYDLRSAAIADAKLAAAKLGARFRE